MVDLERRKSTSHALTVDSGPTPEEIRRATAEIRRNWSPRVYQRRRAEAVKVVGLIEMPSVARRKGTFDD